MSMGSGCGVLYFSRGSSSQSARTSAVCAGHTMCSWARVSEAARAETTHGKLRRGSVQGTFQL